MSGKFYSIGESLHASIPKYGKVMRELNEMGEGAYTNQSEPLDFIRDLIQSQADEGADYIAVNVDDFGDIDPALTKKLMLEYVRLVRKWGKGVPACIDSSDDEVLIAGLKEWYNTDDKVAQPLMNSIKVYNADKLMPYKKDYDYAFIGLLMPEDEQSLSKTDPVSDLFALAKEIFDKAVDKFGFKPGEIFFDTTVFPLAIDMPMEPGQCGYTYRTFETIKRIKNDDRMKDVHFSLGVSNSCRDLPGRKIGVCRAYVAKAMEYGLDAGIVNVSHHLAEKDADPELIKMVDSFARMDGSPGPLMEAMDLMGKFCQETKKK